MSFTGSAVIQRVNTGQGWVSTDLLSCFIRGLNGLQYIGTGALLISTNTPDEVEPGELVLVFSSGLALTSTLGKSPTLTGP